MFYAFIFIIVSVSVFLVAYALFIRPQQYLRLEAAPKKKKFSLKLSSETIYKIFKPLIFLSKPLVPRFKYLTRLKEQTEIMRIGMDVYMLMALKLLLGLILGALVYMFFNKMSVWYAPMALIIGFFLPDYMMVRKIRAKKEAIIRCFPETVDLLHMCINAGADLISAIKWVIEKSGMNPFIEQLGIVLSEVQVGKPRVEALKDMARRLRIGDVSSFSRVIVQAERMGTPVEEAFKNLSDDTRNRRFQHGERYAIKASLKILFPLIFCILPAIMIIVAGPIIIKFSQGDMIPGSF